MAGIDEAGRGALAGPVAVGAVVLPGEQVDLMSRLGGIRDSKIMTPAEREHWAAEIKKVALAWGWVLLPIRKLIIWALSRQRFWRLSGRWAP